MGIGQEGVEHLRHAVELCKSLQVCLGQNPLKPATQSRNSGGFKSRATLGVMLKGTQIDTLVVGGPAYNCGMLERGDEIIKVGRDAVQNEEHLLRLMTGTDEPGTIAALTIKRRGLERKIELKRMPAAMLADNLRMFETFTQVSHHPWPWPWSSSLKMKSSRHTP